MRRWIVAIVLCAGSAAAPRGARAQSREDVARADALFNAAKALTDAGQFADACAKFAESKRLAPGLGVTLYLADCYEHIGRTASAWSEFRSAEGLARDRSDKRADVARARAQNLEPRLTRLTITLSPYIARTGLQLLRDGVAVADEELGLPVPVDPGDHTVVASAPGHQPRTFNVHTGPESATVQVDSLDEPAARTPAAGPSQVLPGALPSSTPASASFGTQATSTPATTPDSLAATASPDAGGSPPGGSRRWIGLGVGGLGVAGVAVGSVFGYVAMSKRDQSNNGACDARDMCSRAGLGLRQDAESAATISTVAFIAGGVALAAGAVLYLTAPRSSSVTVAIAPTPMAGGGGGLVEGRF
ncbi:MAG: hypothetical protein JOZ69_24195 [Myxococcales bacterium]|nr:hypothetical protein [Myxococcales bacterium]